MGRRGFRDLQVWQRSKDLAVRICQLSRAGGFGTEFWLRDQICRSAVSIASNIAEGDERDTDRGATRFFYIAKGSLAELRTQLQIACEADVLDKQLYDAMESESEAVGRMLGSLIKMRRRAESPQR